MSVIDIKTVEHALINCDSYREVLQFVVKESDISFSELGYRLGFSSRNSLREIITGRRRITSKTLPLFFPVLKLKSTSQTLFKYLVAKDEPEVIPQKMAPGQIERKISLYKSRLKAQSNQKNGPDLRNILSLEYYLPVFATFGDTETGLSLKEISDKTRISQKVCLETLNEMEKAKIVRVCMKSNCYYPTQDHISFEHLGDWEQKEIAQQIYLKNLDQLKKRVKTDYQSETDLFLNSIFSVKSKQLPELKVKLRNLIQEFVDETDLTVGDRISLLSVGMTSYTDK